MNTSGIGKLRGAAAVVLEPQVRRNRDTSSDRDAQGGGYERQQTVKSLTPEQEDAAVKVLNEMPSFAKAGLRAEIMREDGKPPHVVVKDASGAIIRRLSYEQIVNLYVHRSEDVTTGRLINRAA